jgi:hypothetical protein
MKVYNRADIVNFMKTEKDYTRMQGFTEGGKSLNSSTYDRRYIDEKTERSDVTGYSPEIAYAFDRIVDNPIHDIIAEIHDEEKVGETVQIVTVNFNKKTEEGYEAKLRTYSVIPDSDGDSTDAYTYSGTFHAAGDITKGIATISTDGMTATFSETTSTENTEE